MNQCGQGVQRGVESDLWSAFTPFSPVNPSPTHLSGRSDNERNAVRSTPHGSHRKFTRPPVRARVMEDKVDLHMDECVCVGMFYADYQAAACVCVFVQMSQKGQL